MTGRFNGLGAGNLVELMSSLASTPRWAVGVTTAPRTKPTLALTLQSLAQAGWATPQLFAEPESSIPATFRHLNIRWRPYRMGAFPNWYTSLRDLYGQLPTADAYFLCQDDVLLASGLREYLEDELWPGPDCGVVSVYCPSHIGREAATGFHESREGAKTMGALAWVLPRQSVDDLLDDEVILDHCRFGTTSDNAGIDAVVGSWCVRANRPYYVHVPSLAQHIGSSSTIWCEAACAGRRRARKFVKDVTHLTRH